MTSTQLHTSTGSKPVISGIPVAIFDADAIMADLRQRLAVSLVDLVGEENEALKEALSQHPDWADLLDDATVSATNGRLEYSVDNPLASDLEYGNPQENIVATGTLRSFAKTRSHTVGSNLVKKVLGLAHNA